MNRCYEKLAIHHVLSLPELLLHIAEYLHQFDITVCLRVSSTWYSILHPLVWHTVVADMPVGVLWSAPRTFPFTVQISRRCPRQQPCHPQGPTLPRILDSFPVALLHKNAVHIRSYTEKVPLMEELMASMAVYLPPFRNLVHFETLILSKPLLDLLMLGAVQKTLESLTCQSVEARTEELQPGERLDLNRHRFLVSEFWLALEELPKLRTLTLKNAIVNETDVWNFFKVLKQLECIQVTHTLGQYFVPFSNEGFSFAHTLETVGRPKTATAAWTPSSPSPGATRPDGLERDTSGRLLFPRLRSFTLHSNLADSAFQLEWLRHFPALEHFQWGERWVMDLSAIAQIFYEPLLLCPGSQDRAFRSTLQSLDLSDTGLGDSTLMKIIASLPNLRHLDVSGTLFGEHSARELLQRRTTTRECGQRYNGQGKIPTARVAATGPALASLNLKGCAEVSSKTLQTMLETFSDLRVFKATFLSVRDMLDFGPLQSNSTGNSSRKAHYFHRPWACLQIENLEVTFCDLAILGQFLPRSTCVDGPESIVCQLGVGTGGPSSFAAPDTVNSSGDSGLRSLPSTLMVDLARQVVYDQLSKLTKLVRLGLGENTLTRTVDPLRPLAHNIRKLVKHDPVLDLTLAHGLETLGSLTRLEELDLQSASPQMNISDVQWMVQAWPQLRKLRSQLSPPEKHNQIVSYLKEYHPRVRILTHLDPAPF
ncbi:hypothetical protein EMPS_10582 [Entomortierella parvispora]|uniref:F-box domain-containing protein n=1 Tax=Entomortierella parvispora TaxID=205924 RepID=A0A9P3HKL4_9FUNG|nr:hypothetical protein EMPS_10582 [Entomortierella parvispora]